MNNHCTQPQAHPDRCGCEPDAFQIARHSKRLVEQQQERIAALEAERDRLCSALRKVLATHDYHTDDGEAASEEAHEALAAREGGDV